MIDQSEYEKALSYLSLNRDLLQSRIYNSIRQKLLFAFYLFSQTIYDTHQCVHLLKVIQSENYAPSREDLYSSGIRRGTIPASSIPRVCKESIAIALSETNNVRRQRLPKFSSPSLPFDSRGSLQRYIPIALIEHPYKSVDCKDGLFVAGKPIVSILAGREDPLSMVLFSLGENGTVVHTLEIGESSLGHPKEILCLPQSRFDWTPPAIDALGENIVIARGNNLTLSCTSGEESITQTMDPIITALNVSNTMKDLIIGTDNGFVTVMDVERGIPHTKVCNHPIVRILDSYRSDRFYVLSKNGLLLLIETSDSSIKVISSYKSKMVDASNGPLLICVNENNKHQIAIGKSPFLQYLEYREETGEFECFSHINAGGIGAICFTPDGKYVACASNSVELYSLPSLLGRGVFAWIGPGSDSDNNSITAIHPSSQPSPCLIAATESGSVYKFPIQ